MNIVLAMFLSVGIKAISAIIEIVMQILMTRSVGVNGYGEYTFLVSLVETAYFVLFSGSIKLNTFYLSTPELSLNAFKENYFKKYVLPIISILFILSVTKINLVYSIATVILLTYFFAFDKSSTLIARGKQGIALLGEYLLGRIVMLIGIIILIKIDMINTLWLFILYGLQFLIMWIWLKKHDEDKFNNTSEIRVPIKKLVEFQKSDIANALISYTPVILQYMFGSAFTAGFAGILTILKKIVNFIAGPTAKVFLPECSRLYKRHELEKLKKTYLMIVKIQMVVIGAASALLLGFPSLVLNAFNPQLVQYSNLLIFVAVSLLFAASIGPVTGFLQMTGNEIICNRNQWISIVVMFIVCVIMRDDSCFAVYGLCAQAISEGLLKYYSICKWFKSNIVSVKQYILFVLPLIIFMTIVQAYKLNDNVFSAIMIVTLTALWNFYFVIQDNLVRETLFRFIRK